MADIIPAKAVYAPFLGLIIWEAGDPSARRKTGVLEQGSKVQIDPIQVGKAHDLRHVACRIKVTALDCEALQSTRLKFMPFMNQMVYAGFLCSGGGFIDGPFRYNFRPELLEQRGMRWVHELTGLSRFPGWITMLEDQNGDWSNLKNDFGETNAPFLQ